MVAVAVCQEDVLRPQPVDDHAGIEEQVELWDDERGVPCCSRSSGENILLVFTRESPFEDLRMSGLGEGSRKIRSRHVGEAVTDDSDTNRFPLEIIASALA